MASSQKMWSSLTLDRVEAVWRPAQAASGRRRLLEAVRGHHASQLGSSIYIYLALVHRSCSHNPPIQDGVDFLPFIAIVREIDSRSVRSKVDNFCQCNINQITLLKYSRNHMKIDYIFIISPLDQ